MITTTCRNVIFAVMLGLWGAAAMADATVTATGTAFCFDGVGNRKLPLTGARVELMDSDCLGSQVCDDVMVLGRVGPMGEFTVSGNGGDPFGGKPDVYVRFVLDDGAGVRMTDEVGITRSVSVPEHDHDNVSDGSTINFGELVFDSGAAWRESGQCAVFLAVRDAYRDFVMKVAPKPPAGYIDIQYWSAIFRGTPWTNTDTIHWPIGYPSDAAFHEFGHSIRHAADGSGAHFTNDVVRFRYARGHHPCKTDSNAQAGELLESVIGYNFNEGWANYWGGRSTGCNGPEVIAEFDEGVVGFYLYSLAKYAPLTRAQMVQVLVDNPGSIHSFDEFKNKAIGVAASMSPLVQQAEAENHPAVANLATSYASSQATELTRRHINELRAHMAAKMRFVDTAVAGPSPTRLPCRDEDCEKLFRKVVGTALLQGEQKAMESRIALLERSLDERWRAAAQKALVDGKFEEWKATLRRAQRKDAADSMLAAVTRAQQNLFEVQDKFADAYGHYDRVLKQAKARLERAARTDGPRAGDGGWLPQGLTAADVAKSTAPASTQRWTDLATLVNEYSQLAQRFRPYLKFSRAVDAGSGVVDEKYRPASWRWLYSNSSLVVHGDVIQANLTTNPEIVLEYSKMPNYANDSVSLIPGPGAWGGQSWAEVQAGEGIYARLSELGDTAGQMVIITYWVLFARNDGAQNHDGDLIGVMLVYDRASDAIVRVAYSAHGTTLHTFDLTNADLPVAVILRGRTIDGGQESVEAVRVAVPESAFAADGRGLIQPSFPHVYFTKDPETGNYEHLAVYMEWGAHEPYPNEGGSFFGTTRNDDGISFLPSKVAVLGPADAPFMAYGGLLGDDPKAIQRHKMWHDFLPFVGAVDRNPYESHAQLRWPPSLTPPVAGCLWSSFTSEENPPNQCVGGVAVGMRCRGRYCDDLALLCCPIALPTPAQPIRTQFFSEENAGRGFCPDQRAVTGITCQGNWCDNVSLTCSATNQTMGQCTWMANSFSEEGEGRELCPAGQILGGVQCEGSNCDSLRLLCCGVVKP